VEIVNFSDIYDTFTKNLKRNMVIPIIGSGFTLNSEAKNGKVPSGKDYQEYMIDSLCNKFEELNETKGEMYKESFSKIAELYIKQIDDIDKRNYFVSNFTDVKIQEKNKIDFLKIEWPYIYTLNIDDAIEKNSKFNHTICCNNENVIESVFDEFNCVIKLHGDVNNLINYGNYNSIIFSSKQYATSLESNKVLLNKLNHDALYQNLLFIGCSLNDEIDILTVLPDERCECVTSRYLCFVGEPTKLESMKYESFGITHIVKFNSYDDIYQRIYKSWVETQKIATDDLDNYKSFIVEQSDDSFETNKSFFLYGKSLVDKNKITLPHFFISREITKNIIADMRKFNLQFVIGSSYSGKTYIFYDIATKIKDQDIFIFETKDRISEKAFTSLLNKKNSIFLFDSNSLTISQIELIMNGLYSLRKNNNKIIIFSLKNNSELFGLIRLLEDNETISKHNFSIKCIDNKFSTTEAKEINSKLTGTGIGIINKSKTILDNILDLSSNNKISTSNKFNKIQLLFDTEKQIATLIILAIEKKVYSSQILKFNILSEIYNQKSRAYPLIDLEETWNFEISASDNSPQKYVVNAEYWLYKQLELFSENAEHHKIIVNAFKYIVSKIIETEGKPDILKYNKQSYKKFILFDNINMIFRIYGRDSLVLISKIYEGLNCYLSNDPNYLHQRAKCYIKLASSESGYDKKIELFEKSHRDANLAYQIFEQRYHECGNNKILISLAHVEYTQAVILCHKCKINNYQNVDDNTTAILTLDSALASPHNSYDYAKKDYINYDNVVLKLFDKAMLNSSIIKDEAKNSVENLFKLLKEN
jgi:hypothetical protein